MRTLFDIQDKMEDELKSICRKDEITSVDLENTYKIVDIIKDITTIDVMRKADYDGYSGTNMDYSRGWDVDYSYARGRNSRDSYESRDSSYGNSNRGRSYEGSRDRSYGNGYSGHGNDEIIDHLTAMMRSARTEEERENYRKTIEQLSR